MKLLLFLYHPNIFIKNQFLNYTKTLLDYLNPQEKCHYFYETLKKFLKVSPIVINYDLVQNYSGNK